MMPNKPLIIAHRGAKGMAPENTLAAFRLALSQGCQGIELDIHLTADDHIVVCHDSTLDRTTNGSGAIVNQTLMEIQAYDAGGWCADEYKGEIVPTLDEVFELVPQTVMINIEVKNAYSGRIECKLIDLLRQRGRVEDVVISSFDHKCIRRIKQMEPRLKIGLLYQANLLDPVAYARGFDVEVYSLHPQFQMLDAEDVQQAVAQGLRVYPFTANSEKDLSRLMEMGVSGIITDFPCRMKELVDARHSG
ncbi:glycerophosphodiester phosphodiesterase [Paenibacillus xerothermodurans]|uniref:Glycerophosphodiester phosphodiesterase n=1 Tax=Paenibacillus xerothermodurans TaxID=1977292 RepID=A0A2W1N9I9_PAEXE|nr:glycerophosphodiester phosphodiesterase [Paenibacillus xerothermodurans]PZE19821.1 glycerophosphodiester phosphodiesterase [Paenibacillus xerothermodurans]